VRVLIAKLTKLAKWFEKKQEEWSKSSKWFMKFVMAPAAQAGEFSVSGVVTLLVGILVIGTIIGALWATVAGTDTTIQALTGTDLGTTNLQTFWPIALMCVGIGLGVGAIMWALRKAGVID
jgi:hypothetical protein